MICSMTGYGRGIASRDGREMTVELKSVNHRYLDLGMRLPRHIGFLEDVFRTELSAKVSRGHVDLFVSYRNGRNDARVIVIDEALLAQYLIAARGAGERLGLPDDLTLSAVLRLPDVSDVVEAEEDRESVAALAREAVTLAVEELKAMRTAEGERLCHDLMQRAQTVLALTEEIAQRAPLVVQEYRQKLNERIEQLLGETEPDRARLAKAGESRIPPASPCDGSRPFCGSCQYRRGNRQVKEPRFAADPGAFCQ